MRPPRRSWQLTSEALSAIVKAMAAAGMDNPEAKVRVYVDGKRIVVECVDEPMHEA